MRSIFFMFLIVVDAILAGAIELDTLGPVDIHLMGLIMLGGGFLGVIVDLLSTRGSRKIEMYVDRF